MRNTAKFLVAGAFALALAFCALWMGEVSISAQARPAQTPAAQQQLQQQTPTFRSSADLVTTDVIVRVWLTTPFEGGRHIARISKIDEPCK